MQRNHQANPFEERLETAAPPQEEVDLLSTACICAFPTFTVIIVFPHSTSTSAWLLLPHPSFLNPLQLPRSLKAQLHSVYKDLSLDQQDLHQTQGQSFLYPPQEFGVQAWTLQLWPTPVYGEYFLLPMAKYFFPWADFSMPPFA